MEKKKANKSRRHEEKFQIILNGFASWLAESEPGRMEVNERWDDEAVKIAEMEQFI